MNAIEDILTRMKTHDTLMCCGLDPDLRRIPFEIADRKTSDESKVFDFLKMVIDITAPHVCAYKAQKAFFDMLAGGHEVLKELIFYVHTSHKGIPVIVDCKIGDIDNTMNAYIHNLFVLLQADGVVVNPYMGDDVMMPLTEFPDKAIVTLVKTSNPGGGIIQDVLLQNGLPLWQHILDLVVNRWNKAKNMIPVISSTTGINTSQFRLLIPDRMPIFLAGIGAQGGTHMGLRSMLNSEGIGVIVNSSRGILYPKQDNKNHWCVAVERAITEMKGALNMERGVM